MTMRIYADRGGKNTQHGRRRDLDAPADGWTRVRVYPDRKRDQFIELEVNDRGFWTVTRFAGHAQHEEAHGRLEEFEVDQ